MKPDYVYLTLPQRWPPDAPPEEQRDLYQEIKTGKKTVEYRDAVPFWASRLLTSKNVPTAKYRSSYKNQLKVHRAWFTIGYPKGSVPRLEADITDLIYDPDTKQFEIHIANVEEVTK
jgi:hypothetical protein